MSKKSLAAHQTKCPSNPNRKYVSYTLGKTAWNKGLTKDTDMRVAQGARTLTETLKNREERFGFAREGFWTDERRKQKSEWRKELHRRDPSSHPNRKLAGNKNKMSYPEKVAYEFLSRGNIKFEHQAKIESYYVDFLIDNLIIEIDGEYWHDDEKDAIRDKHLNTLGFIVHRVKAKSRIEESIREILVKQGLV